MHSDAVFTHSGVGTLPLAATSAVPPSPVTDEKLVVLYERQKRIQYGAGVVAGLLGKGFDPSESGAQGARESQSCRARGRELGSSARRGGGAEGVMEGS